MTTPDAFAIDAVPQVHVAWGGLRRLDALLTPGLRRALIVTDRGLAAAGHPAAAAAALEAAGLAVAVFDGIAGEPDERALHAAVALGRAHGAEAVVGLGGGSAMDVAKLAALLIRSPQPLAEAYGIGRARGPRLELVQVPTTAGTGSEATGIAILIAGGDDKLGVVARQLYADRVLLDAETTVGLPRHVTAATGVDAMVHAIEASTSRLRRNPWSDALARAALRLLIDGVPAACRDGADRAARSATLLGANCAGQAFANAPVGGVHALAYPLGGRCHIPHGLANALMLVPVLRFNRSAAAPIYADLADAVLGPAPGDAACRADRFIDRLAGLMRACGLPARLRDAGVPEALLPQLAADAMRQSRLLVNNPVEIDEAAALALYREAY